MGTATARLRWLTPLVLAAAASARQADTLPRDFVQPPDEARPGVYWYFMDGNLSREGMTRDLESMVAAGLGHLVFLEVNVGVPRGPVDFFGDAWRELFVHAVREAERLGIEITLGAGPGWTGSGGPWVRAEQSMQHLVAGRIDVQGPTRIADPLPVPPPPRPFFGDVPQPMRAEWEGWFADVAVLAFPTPEVAWTLPEVDERALVYRAPISSQPGVRPFLAEPERFEPAPQGSTIPREGLLDLTGRLQPDGTLDWDVPEGRWTVLRLVGRNNGASTRPAPVPGIGFECDKLDPAALDAHFAAYAARLLDAVGPRKPGRGWTFLHMDSWEMGAQSWTPALRQEFQRRRGYDPLPFYPAMQGLVVDSREVSERFLWDLRRTCQELVIENHAERLKALAREHGLQLSIEPYDMTPLNDLDLGAVADVPMCEFWSVGFDTAYSCQEASSIAHVLGRPVVAAEAFTAAPGEDWRLYPGALKDQGDWAFGVGINRLTFHTFAHKPDEGRPGMVMGPYGVHWDRGQTWWPLVEPYHRYLARCQQVLRQGRTVADLLYLMPEGAPNVFQPPPSASSGSARMPDRRGYGFDGCSADLLMRSIGVRDGRIAFPSGASYRVLVLPRTPAMTPGLLAKLEELVREGAVVVGAPPLRSPSLSGHPACDEEVARRAERLWGAGEAPPEATERVVGQGRIWWGGALEQLEATQYGPGLYPGYDAVARVLDALGEVPDFESAGPLRYTHRTTPEREIYFVANRSDARVETHATFRIARGAPELWDPVTSRIRALAGAEHLGERTRVPLRLEAHESAFVVFPLAPEAAAAPADEAPRGFPDLRTVAAVEGPWEVSFEPGLGAPGSATFERLQDWTSRPEDGIRHYSGIATYRTRFELPGEASASPGGDRFLDLGEVQVMARVRLNGVDCGVAWTAPWRVDVTGALRVGENTLEIEVANLWPNRMIADAATPEAAISRTTYRPYQASDPLLPSGLLGPVTLQVQDAR